MISKKKPRNDKCAMYLLQVPIYLCIAGGGVDKAVEL